MQAHAWQLLALESEHIHYLQDSDGTPYVVLRECDRKLIRHRSAEHLYRTGDQAFRAQMRATMVSRKAHTWLIRDPALLATLRDRLCVGKRAPSAMLVAGPDMVQLLQHYKRHDVAKQLQTALAQLRPSADGCAPLGRADTRKRRRSLSSSSEPLNEEAKTSDSDEKGVSKTRSSEMSCIVMDKEEDKHHDTLKHSRVLGDHDDCPEPDRKKTRVAKEMRQLATWSVAPLTHNQRRRNKHKRGVKQHAVDPSQLVERKENEETDGDSDSDDEDCTRFGSCIPKPRKPPRFPIVKVLPCLPYTKFHRLSPVASVVVGSVSSAA